MGLLDESLRDDTTGKGSVTRIALLTAALTLEGCLAFALWRFNVTGREGWVPIIEKLTICLAAVLTGYAARMISSAIASKRETPDA